MSKKASLKINQNINSIVIGDSHSECAFNDSLISNFKNFSQSGETYFYTYIKTKKLLEENPQLETVFIEFTNYSISPSIDENIWSDKYINYRYPNFSAFMEWEERLLLIKNNLKSVIAAIPVTLNKQASRIINNNYNYVSVTGGYFFIDENKLNFDINNNNVHRDSKNKVIHYADYNIKYLLKTVVLCQEENVQIVLIRSPLHEKSLSQLDENIFQKIRKDKFHNIPFLDFKDFVLADDEFRDTDHLNYLGAKKFSLQFNQLLKQYQRTYSINDLVL